VTLQDAVTAVLVADASMAGASLLGATNALHTHFPDDPDADYERLERLVLAGLGLVSCNGGKAQESCI
jgi:DNA helicase MCM9